MNLPGLYLHELKGNRERTWSVRVSDNWRVTLQFDRPDKVFDGLRDIVRGGIPWRMMSNNLPPW
jgi:hypothetical protein